MAKKEKESKPAASSPTFPLVLRPATDRDDKGQTENYRIFAGGSVVQVKNRRGELVNKNAILGGNGTIYIANELSAGHDEWVILPRTVFDRMVKGGK